MKIRLNGEQYETKAKTVAELLRELDIHPGRVAVEVNLQIVKKAQYEEFILNEGDTVEVVHFVGGGQYGR
jgi:thiamine biosynthesis protein ThiS